MPRLSYAKLLDTLGRRPGGVFFLSGDEAFLREEGVRRVVDAHLEPASRDFNLDQLRGPEASAEALASLLATPPMMANWRVVVVRDAQGLSTKARSLVEAAAADPPEGLVLVISASIPSGSQAAFYRNLERQAMAVQFPALDALDAPIWAAERAAAVYQVEMEPDAARALVAAVGTDLGTLAGEVDKLAEGARDRGRVTLDDVEALVGAIPRVNRWAWVDLIGDRRWQEAMEQLPVLLAAGESGVALIIAIGSHLLRLAVAAAGGESGLERALQRRQSGLIRRLVAQSRGWTVGELDSALEELLRADRLLKTGPPSELQAMQELLLRLRAVEPVAPAAAPGYVGPVRSSSEYGR